MKWQNISLFTNLHDIEHTRTPGTPGHSGLKPGVIAGKLLRSYPPIESGERSPVAAPIESGEPKPREKNSAIRALVAYLFLWKFGKRHSDFRFPASDFKFILYNDLIDPLNYIFWLCFWQLPVGPNLLVYYHQLLLCTSFLLVFACCKDLVRLPGSSQ